MSFKPVIGGSGFYDRPSGGGGASVPGLPVWTYDGGATPTASQFSTDQATPAATGLLRVSDSAKNGNANWETFLQLLPVGAALIFTNTASGASSAFLVTTISDQAGFVDFGVQSLASPSGNWLGDYQVEFAYVQVPTLAAILTRSSITPIADNVYQVGIGGSQNGTITISGGIITAVQEALP